MSTRLRIAALLFTMAHSVLISVGVVAVLLTPQLAAKPWTTIPLAIGLGALLAAPISWILAGRFDTMLTRAAARVDAPPAGESDTHEAPPTLAQNGVTGRPAAGRPASKDRADERR